MEVKEGRDDEVKNRGKNYEEGLPFIGLHQEISTKVKILVLPFLPTRSPCNFTPEGKERNICIKGEFVEAQR